MGRGEEPREGGGEEPKAASLSLPSHRASLSLSSHRASLSPSSRQAPTVSRGQPLEGASQRHEGFSHTTTMGTRPTQSTKVRHTPRRSVPRYVSPFVGARYPVQSGQVGAGRTAQAFVSWDLSAQSGGASNLPSPWERPGVGSKDILLSPSAGLRRPYHHPRCVRVLVARIIVFINQRETRNSEDKQI